MIPNKVTYVTGCDWAGLYIDGKKVFENDTIWMHDITRLLGIEEIELTEEQEEKMMNGGYDPNCYLPDKLEDL